jgi:hypothetical protein
MYNKSVDRETGVDGGREASITYIQGSHTARSVTGLVL